MSPIILVVDDNKKNNILLTDVLQYYGYTVIKAFNGEEGIKVAKEQLPCLIFMDIQMPTMDGLTAIKILKKDPITESIKIIAVTSFAMPGDKEKIIAAGADDYIAKPIKIKQLPRIIKKHLRDEKR